MTEPAAVTTKEERWLTPGVVGIGSASLLADVGHEIPTGLLPSMLTSTLGAPASVLGLIEGISDALAGTARFAGGALADDPTRRRRIAVGGYAGNAALAALTGAATAVWQVGVLRAAAWTARGLRVPARNALLADVVAPSAYGRAYGFERTMDNLGAVFGPLLALGLVAWLGVRTAIGLSVIPGLLAAVAIIYAIRATTLPTHRDTVALRIHIRPVLVGELGRLMAGVTAFEVGNVAATLLILRASSQLGATHSTKAATTLALALYVAYNLAATLASLPPGGWPTVSAPAGRSSCSAPVPRCSCCPTSASPTILQRCYSGPNTVPVATLTRICLDTTRHRPSWTGHRTHFGPAQPGPALPSVAPGRHREPGRWHQL